MINLNRLIETRRAARLKIKSEEQGKKRSDYQLAKAAYQFRVFLVSNIKGVLFLAFGVVSAGFGLKSFLLPARFIDGGATGISLLVKNVTGWPLALLLVLINIPFILVGYRQLGFGFFIKTAASILGLAIVVAIVPYPVVTDDKLLVAVFGGFFIGAGIGLAVRGGTVLDGTEILAIVISRKTGMTIGDVILVFNIVIFSAAAYILGINSALYSILTYLSASKTVDFIIEGIEEYTGVTIISPKIEEISTVIIQKLGRGITVYRGKRGYGKRGHVSADMDILFVVVTRLEVSRLKTEVEAIDPNAFVVMQSIRDARGGMIKKRPFKE